MLSILLPKTEIPPIRFNGVIPPRSVGQPLPVFCPKPPNREGQTTPGSTIPPGVDGISHRFSVGFADTCGHRQTMEDKMVMRGRFRNRKDEDFFAIFDGHGGTEAATFASETLHKKLESQLEEVDDESNAVLRCLHDSFLDCHIEMKKTILESGTTGIIAYFQRNRFFIANLGDSRVVVSQSGIAKPLSIDQKPNFIPEKRRILNLGGWVTGGRVQSRLAVARALGDFPLNPFICCEPEVFGPWYFSPNSNDVRETNNFDLMILGCDGLWDVCDNETAVKKALRSQTPQAAALKLREYASEQGTKDNVSVIVIFFPGYVPGKYGSLESDSDTSEHSDSQWTESEDSDADDSS